MVPGAGAVVVAVAVWVWVSVVVGVWVSVVVVVAVVVAVAVRVAVVVGVWVWVGVGVGVWVGVGVGGSVVVGGSVALVVLRQPRTKPIKRAPAKDSHAPIARLGQCMHKPACDPIFPTHEIFSNLVGFFAKCLIGSQPSRLVPSVIICPVMIRAGLPQRTDKWIPIRHARTAIAHCIIPWGRGG